VLMQAHESCSAYTAFACVCVRDGSKDVGEDEMRSRSGQSAMIAHQHTCTYTHTYTHAQSLSCSLSPFLTNIHTSPLAAATFPLSCTHSSFPHRRCRPVMSAQACHKNKTDHSLHQHRAAYSPRSVVDSVRPSRWFWTWRGDIEYEPHSASSGLLLGSSGCICSW